MSPSRSQGENGLERRGDPIRQHALAEQRGAEELLLDDAFQGRQILPRLLVVVGWGEHTATLPVGMPSGPAACHITKNNIRGTIVAFCRKRSSSGRPRPPRPAQRANWECSTRQADVASGR